MSAPPETAASRLRRLIEPRVVYRYVVVTIIVTLPAQGLLYYLHAMQGRGAVTANAAAFVVFVGPQYLFYRYWVWRSRAKDDLIREVTLFWSVGFLGLVVSTGAVAIVERSLEHPLLVNAASLAAFGAVWVAKLFLLDRVVFPFRASR